ncbi:3-carboxy-cis,cis-muconate cycloisomerase [Streptomyces pactum]|uniref:3-carboxy-cis,cis-muconate cycloisomerase n=1 Tax=Streptomyces pactum TaxID=68249 RepID=A0ABS0NDP0_9ACTN|nr:3-carboxy-cis,cis-muconate cycloisomerase [Streptomyces pactum]MBH5333295.1 3-carboxy-cis,cis-muconate cycloisomerase [Streptomyces pactum]
MTAPDIDAGLLAPGRAGTPAESATADTAFLRAMLDAEAALTRAQATLGHAPAEAARAVTDAAGSLRPDVTAVAHRARDGGNPVIPLIADLTAALPDEFAPYVHRGATSQDIMDTATMLVAARTADLTLDDLRRTERALSRLAAEHRDTAMPGRTLTQHAVPTTFGLKAAGWRSLTLDARDRLRAVRASLPVQLGGAAGTMAAFGGHGGRQTPDPAERLTTAYARETGLTAPDLPWHTLRTPVADLAGALAFTAGALGKMASDVLTLSRTEIAELSEGAGGGSSAMPHKRNPVRATLIAAAARRAPGLAATLYASMAAEDERPAGAWHAEWETLRDLLRLVGGAAHRAAELTEGLRVHPDTMREHLESTAGLIVSERLAAALAPALGRARAAALLTELAARTRTEGRSLAALLAEQPELHGLRLDIDDLTDPTRYTGSAGALTDRALERQ